MDPNIVFPRTIRYLLAIAEYGTFTRAAEMLCVTQPTLSQQIKQLEEALDMQLLDRTGRTVRLTEAGELFVRYARRALGEMETGRRAVLGVKDLSRGSLRLAMTPVTEYLVASLLENFNSRYPGIVLSTLEMSQDNIEAALLEDRLDAGIAFTNVLSSGARSTEIETHILFMEPLNLVVGEAHPCARRHTPLRGDELEQTSLVLLNTQFALRRHVDTYCLEHCIKPRVAVETGSLGIIVEMVRLGRLATVLPRTIARSQGGLYPIMLLPELPHHTITMICHKGAYRSPACRAFYDLACEWSAHRLGDSYPAGRRAEKLLSKSLVRASLNESSRE